MARGKTKTFETLTLAECKANGVELKTVNVSIPEKDGKPGRNADVEVPVISNYKSALSYFKGVDGNLFGYLNDRVTKEFKTAKKVQLKSEQEGPDKAIDKMVELAAKAGISTEALMALIQKRTAESAKAEA
jgi:hypothetical protein